MKKTLLKMGLQYISMETFTQQKERSDMILEPLQVMIQLSLLNFCPVGTKVSVSENILHIQQPTYFQGAIRWWNNDNKDDLYYLFHAIRRYYKWYKTRNEEVYTYILKLAVSGISKLTETYSKTDRKSISHTLNLYKNVLELDTPDLFKDTNSNSIDIDSVFQNITTIYPPALVKIIFSILNLLKDEQKDIHRQSYLNGLLLIMEPVNINIRSWIHKNLTC
tara:strand:+ start:1238 stop:1900 length:663 start_codon:yes stop_codon:yes gene_type:complete